MINEKELTSAEREYSFVAPRDFRDGLAKLGRILESTEFKKSNPGFAAVTVPDMRLAWDAELPIGFVPFCSEAQPSHTDYYCFHRTMDNNPQIVVFADHAVVYDWPDMKTFLQWLESQPTAQ